VGSYEITPTNSSVIAWIHPGFCGPEAHPDVAIDDEKQERLAYVDRSVRRIMVIAMQAVCSGAELDGVYIDPTLAEQQRGWHRVLVTPPEDHARHRLARVRNAVAEIGLTTFSYAQVRERRANGTSAEHELLEIVMRERFMDPLGLLETGPVFADREYNSANPHKVTAPARRFTDAQLGRRFRLRRATW